jgi:hypothetical protein
MAERSIAAVLKTVEGKTSGGSNPSLSAIKFSMMFKGSQDVGSSGPFEFFHYKLI